MFRIIILIFLAGCAQQTPMQVVDSDISNIGANFIDPVYIPTNGCLITTNTSIQGVARIVC